MVVGEGRILCEVREKDDIWGRRIPGRHCNNHRLIGVGLESWALRILVTFLKFSTSICEGGRLFHMYHLVLKRFTSLRLKAGSLSVGRSE